MKLKNKKTGEILEEARSSMVYKDNFRIYDERTDRYFTYNSLAELNAEWEDAPEESKKHWFIACGGHVLKCNEDANWSDEKLIGNYFSSREEAEKAVDKLKAWTRLKGKGAEFYGWRRNQTGTYELCLRWEDRIPRSYEIKNDLDLLFGVKE